ncbi:Phosphoenolpyruvate synthase [Halomicronema hongdechloris C2206]|uniref:Phosphoenolpyruvate synthase n=1 Tax=Halomicronema hongdechloris C2206 TaxID=1641165 RepID=A0A1Z3HSR8_9CYAN|nr:putative PEP-binding protein [Halomicronema hongdechloris]ASC73302.1 Phosphoenolpyruvate synthase [Halomicronema hongdechloris C2206]
MMMFPTLNQISASDRQQVGDKAFYLSQLQQQGIAVVRGQVIPARAMATLLAVAQWPDSLLVDIFDLPAALPLEHPEHIVPMAQQLRQALWAAPCGLELSRLISSEDDAVMLLRSSITLEATTGAWSSLMTGMLAPRTSWNQVQALEHHLKGFWADLLTNRALTILQRRHLQLRHVHLAVLMHPLYPAGLSGTLVRDGSQLTLEAVQGLGLAMTQGEAIPSRCSLSLDTQPSWTWQAGYQDVVYRVSEYETPSQSSTTTPPVEPFPGITPQSPDNPYLDQIVSRQQTQALIDLSQRVQPLLGSSFRLDWLIYDAGAVGHRLIVTQAHPVVAAPVVLARENSAAVTVEPPLPAVTTVIRGLGASAGQIMAPALVIDRDWGALSAAQVSQAAGHIVVVRDLQPDRLAHLKGIVGIVSEQGGLTCHAAILARELMIPSVVGAPQVTELIQTDDRLWLDGQRGLIYRLPSSAAVTPLAWQSVPSSPPSDQAKSLEATAATTPPKTKLMANLSQLTSVTRVKQLPIDGIGLLRSEWLLLEALDHRHPQQWLAEGYTTELVERLVERLGKILTAFAPAPVRYRSLDMRSHEWAALAGSPAVELNPTLGIRGTFSYHVSPQLFELELQALARVQSEGGHNLQLLLPFVRTLEEFLECRQLIEQAGLMQVPEFQLWIMAEVPSVLFLLPEYIKAGVQGIAIGTNDLTQLLLAADRDQPLMASVFDERHPVVLTAVNHLIQMAHQYGVPCSICGQAPVRYPELVELLIQWGISSISVEPAAVEQTRLAIVKAEAGKRL